jgi:hypothetical protein
VKGGGYIVKGCAHLKKHEVICTKGSKVSFGPSKQTCVRGMKNGSNDKHHILARSHLMLEHETLYELFVHFRGPEQPNHALVIFNWLGTCETYG